MPEPEIVTMSSLLTPGHTAVITGASSGIGRAAALHFASKGLDVWMLDNDAEELALAHQLVQSQTINDTQHIAPEVVDVADAAAMEKVADLVFSKKDGGGDGNCHILLNNAGIGLGGGAMTDMETVERVMAVNTFGPIHGCLAFLPRMKASGQPGIIINTGSKQGITMPPGNLTYNMSKTALKCYTEGLEHELNLERLDGRGKIRAALLVPGWVNTSILLKAERVKHELKGLKYYPKDAPFHEEKPAEGAWMPSQVVEFMIQELDKGRFYVICPDNDVDRKTDNLRMAWTMNDIVENRPPLSRWHPDFKEKFDQYVSSTMGLD